MYTEKKMSQKKSIAITFLVIVILVASIAAVASTGIVEARSVAPTAISKPVIFKNDGKLYSYDIGKGIKQIEYEKPEKPPIDTSKFITIPPEATKVNILGENDYCVFELLSTDGKSTINFVRPDGSFYTFEIEQLVLDSALLSADKTKILIRNELGELYLVSLKANEVDKYAMVDENVTEAYFTGLKNDIVYMKDKDFYYSSGGYKSLIEKNISNIVIATDDMVVYYTKDDLTLVRFYVGKATIIDSNVYNMVYCGVEKLAYIKDYNSAIGEGNLFYTDGKEVIDVGAKAEDFLE
ncbi:MAG: hypothetical protein AB7E42_08995 [Anaerotignaceae bacterium]